MEIPPAFFLAVTQRAQTMRRRECIVPDEKNPGENSGFQNKSAEKSNIIKLGTLLETVPSLNSSSTTARAHPYRPRGKEGKIPLDRLFSAAG